MSGYAIITMTTFAGIMKKTMRIGGGVIELQLGEAIDETVGFNAKPIFEKVSSWFARVA